MKAQTFNTNDDGVLPNKKKFKKDECNTMLAT